MVVPLIVTYKCYTRKREITRTATDVNHKTSDNSHENCFLLEPQGLDRYVRDLRTRERKNVLRELGGKDNCGLDRYLKDLKTQERKTVMQELGGKDGCGYFMWHAVVEKLDDPDLELESRGWEASDNNVNVDKFLTAYGEKEGIKHDQEIGESH
ncbi:uncharacterized protein LOC111337271 [Stylophora pistillata]|nr:uncharacterized protein LOC111337271 [Stylophora pistillata]XP_022799290.1 uncharacterized protein LOC111337271 [Stylophora pistillata]